MQVCCGSSKLFWAELGSWKMSRVPVHAGTGPAEAVSGGAAAAAGGRLARAAAAAAAVQGRGWSDGGRILANGTLPEGTMGLQQWHTLRFSATGASLAAFFDGSQVAAVTDATYPVGWAGLSTGWHIAQFANFSLTRG
jgi:hypothetical protein